MDRHSKRYIFSDAWQRPLLLSVTANVTVTTEGLAHAHNSGTTTKHMRINLEIVTFAPIIVDINSLKQK